MKSARPHGVIVDAYSSGALLAREFQKRGVTCVHVQSQPDLPAIFVPSFLPSEFHANVVHKGSVEQTADFLRGYEPLFVIPGCELGVLTADALAEQLGLVGNGTGKS